MGRLISWLVESEDVVMKSIKLRHMQSQTMPEDLPQGQSADSRFMSPFSLAAHPGVMVLLDVVTGLEVSNSANIEAILGFLAELKVSEGLLRGSSGQPVNVQACLQFLARLGAKTGEVLAVAECLALCEQIGIPDNPPKGLIAGMRQYIHGSDKRLNRYIHTLEDRGYQVRLNSRLTTMCHAIADEITPTAAAPRRLFSLPCLPMDLSVAA
jgi:hypothetical protein